MPSYQKPELIELVKAAANAAGLDPALVLAVVEQESNFNQFATRYEDGFWTRYVKKNYPVRNTESNSRAISYGLMQLMGEVARELGLSDIQLSDLIDPQLNLKYGCLHLANKLKAAKGDVEKALLLWNGGGAPNYGKEVMARMAKYK